MDESKKEDCNIQFSSSHNQRKNLDRAISDSEVAIEDANEGIKRLTADLAELAAGMKALDKSVAEATKNGRKIMSSSRTHGTGHGSQGCYSSYFRIFSPDMCPALTARAHRRIHDEDRREQWRHRDDRRIDCRSRQ